MPQPSTTRKTLIRAHSSPGGFLLDHGVEDDQEFTHACDDDDLALLPLSLEPVGNAWMTGSNRMAAMVAM
jgi:hypothetical protein